MQKQGKGSMKSDSARKIKGKVVLVDGCLREGNVAKARGTMLGWVRARKKYFLRTGWERVAGAAGFFPTLESGSAASISASASLT
jgi:hypothetical protein